MARIKLTEQEAVEWGLIPAPKYTFDLSKMKEKVLIRVLAGIIVLLVALLISVGGPQLAAVMTSAGG